MSDTAVTATTKSARTKPSAAGPGVPALIAALAFVVGCRLLLYGWMPDRSSDFDFLYHAASRLLAGENPYPTATQWFPYPLPAVLLAVPFTAISLSLARPIFDVLVGGAFVYALWRYRGTYALLGVASGAYLLAMWNGQTTPLMVAAALVPALGFLLAVRPNSAAALWIAWPSLRSLLAASLVLALSLLVLPSWPWDWWLALPSDHAPLMPPILRPFGFILLLSALRWRLPEGRLILAITFIPQTTLPYELVPLVLIPANRLEMGIYVVGTWIAAAAAQGFHLSESMARGTAAGWPVMLGAVYLPMLYLVLRRKPARSKPPIHKERRRPHRLDDAELKVDVTMDGMGEISVKVTHIPSGLFATESGRNRAAAERKAHDKLAGMLRPSEKG
jgi:hypothetical protein